MACAWVLEWLEVIWTPSAWTVGWFERGTLSTSQLSFRLFYGTDYTSLKLNTWSRFTHPFDIDLRHNVFTFGELNVVAVTENVNTFLLVWTHVSRYSVNWLYCCQVYKVLTAVFISTLELSTFIFISYFIHLSIDLLPLTPRGRATASVGEYMGFRIRQRRWIV